MGTISEKLVYLNGTKQAIKQAINEDFEVIDNNTTFREYADEISSNNAKYKDLIPKVNVNGTNALDISNGSAIEKALVTQYGNTKQSILPSEYTQVDYIQSSGSQYIDTGINADTNLRVIVDMAYINYSLANQTIGAIKIGTPNSRYHLLTGAGKINFWVNDNSYMLGTADNNRHLIDMDVPNGQALYDDTIITTPTNIRDTELSFWLFGRNSTDSKYFTQMKLWNCKMYYNGELVRYFIPCYRNSDNEVGMYDLVNDVFYTNQGTGVFTYGSKTPTPDTPQEIVNISGKTTLKVVGNNLFKPFNFTKVSNGITFTYSEDGSININGTSTGNALSMFSTEATPYLITLEVGTYKISGNTNDIRLEVVSSSGTPLCNTGTTNNFTINSTTQIFIRANILSGKTFDNVKIYPQLEKGSTASPYEPYKEQSFDLDLKSKNLFDKDNANVLNAYIGGTTGTINTSDGDKCLYIPIKPNTTYTISKVLSNRFRIGFTDVIPAVGIVCGPHSGNQDTKTFYTITSSNSSKYLVVQYYIRTDTLTEQQILDSIQIEESSTASDYEPFYDINLCKIDTYKDRIKKSTGKNLFDKNNANVLNASLGYGQDNYGKLSSSANAKTLYIPIKSNTTYTVSKISSQRFVMGVIDKTPAIGKICNNIVYTTIGDTSLTITSGSNDTYLCVYYYLASYDTLTEQQILDSIQIEENSSATEYEPFGKVWYLEKKIEKVTLDNSLSYARANATDGYRFTCDVISNVVLKPETIGTIGSLLSNKLVSISANGTYNSINGIGIAASGNLVLYYSEVKNYTSNEFKEWVGNNNIIVYYVVKTPTTEEITENNYPTLYEQLNNTKLFEGVNHLTFTNESGLDVEFDIEYYKNWKLD